MIYLVSNQIKIPEDYSDRIQPLDIESSRQMIRSWPVVQFDTETTGLDCHICKLRSLQFGYKDFKSDAETQIVVDCLSIQPEEYRDVIESSYLIGHNLKFDLEFLFNHKIVPLNLYDTMICEQILYLGYEPKKVKFNLGAVLQRYTGIEIDKSFQKQIATKGLTIEGILYSAQDVRHLQDIRKGQMTVAEYRKCTRAFTVENRAVPAIAYLEWCGIHIDVQKWKDKMTFDKKEMQDYIDKLNDYVRQHPVLSQKYVSTTVQGNLFSDTDTKPEVLIEWSSPAQVVPVFQALGFHTTTFDKEKQKDKNSVMEKLISTQKGIDDNFLDLYFGYKGAEKNVCTYGQNFLNLINPKTNRLHTIFSQLGTVTGRMSSGSTQRNKDLAAYKLIHSENVKYVNLQNLPSREPYGTMCRSSFTSQEGNVFVSCDYSAEESRVQAAVWEEKTLLDAFEHGIDTHNLYAKLCFPEELKDVDVRDVKKLHPELRQKAKSAEFAVAYGSDGTSIAANIGMPVEKARAMVTNLIAGMPGMSKFQKTASKFIRKNGYVMTNTITGHRVYWPEWASWKAFDDALDENFWQEYNSCHKGTGDYVDKQMIAYRKAKHTWFGKNVLNYPIQGGSAVVLKQAMADLFEWIVKNNYFGTILFCVAVHDRQICCA